MNNNIKRYKAEELAFLKYWFNKAKATNTKFRHKDIRKLRLRFIGPDLSISDLFKLVYAYDWNYGISNESIIQIDKPNYIEELVSNQNPLINMIPKLNMTATSCLYFPIPIIPFTKNK